MSVDITRIRELEPAVVSVGSHPATLQAMLDFDFLQGRSAPSIKAIIANGRNNERYFFGKDEVMIPVYESIEKLNNADSLNLFVNLVSGRRVLASTSELLRSLPNLVGGVVFAERLPERHALELVQLAASHQVWIAGGASVGLAVPGHLKLGAIGGVEARQFEASNLFSEGQVAVVSSSGGMVNEIIRTVADAGWGVSFALAVGGERFPITSPRDAFLAAQADSVTQAIAYFGELGGTDEYALAELISSGQVTKPVVAYIAGTVADLFETPPQFGHAKAMAGTSRESATAKRDAMRAAGAHVGTSFGDFVAHIQNLNLQTIPKVTKGADQLTSRKKGLITSSVSYDVAGDVKILGRDLLEFAENSSFGAMVMSMLLGKAQVSEQTANYADFVLRISVDHGPYVSGAVNTIVTARAGRDLVSALTAGLLTIGPRFGGAINEAANIWLEGVRSGVTAPVLVEDYASRRQYISGIGHKKYRSDFPDPRVAKLASLIDDLPAHPFTDFARAVEAETTQKKGNLILNIDGTIAAGLLDVLHQTEGYSYDDLQALVDTEFFNALFVLSRSVGFMAHYFDQRRIDEGLFRLGDDQVTKLT